MFTLGELEEIIAQRAAAGAATSYTAGLLARGTSHCARKFGEEAIETIVAAMGQDSTQIKNEAADLLYHLLVLLRSSDVRLADVMAELSQRTAQSGLAEKASRGPRDD